MTGTDKDAYCKIHAHAAHTLSLTLVAFVVAGDCYDDDYDDGGRRLHAFTKGTG